MRILFTTTGHVGHTLPLGPLAAACVRAGHDVRVAAPASRTETAALIDPDVLTFDGPSDADSARAIAIVERLTPQAAQPQVIGELFGRAVGGTALPGLLDIAGAWAPDLIVRESHEFAGAIAAARAGIPHVRVALGGADGEDEALDLVTSAVRDLAAGAGVDPDAAAGALHAAPALSYVPPALETPRAAGRAPVHRFRLPAGASSPAPPDRWPPDLADRPLVLVTLGTVVGRLPLFPAVHAALIERLAGLDARVLVTVGEAADPALLGRLPRHVRAERWVAQEDVLPHASAVVCHGGHGTVLGALGHAVPLVVLPLFALDQWLNAARVARAGAGVALRGAPRRAFDPPGPDVLDAVPGAVRHVLADPGPRTVAGRIAAELAALPDVAAAVPLLEAVARRPVLAGCAR